MERIGLLHMPIGNLQSAWNALYELGFDPELVDEGSDFDELYRLIMPSGGNSKGVVAPLAEKGLPDKIRSFAAAGRPTLDMQVMATTGTERGIRKRFGIVEATAPPGETA